SATQVSSLVRDIEREMTAKGGTVDSEDIGRAVLERLREVDEVAYLRFASVYKEFQGAEDFERDVAALECATEYPVDHRGRIAQLGEELADGDPQLAAPVVT